MRFFCIINYQINYLLRFAVREKIYLYPFKENSFEKKIKIRFFGYHRDVTPLLAARILGGRLVYTESRNGQWVGVIELQPVVEAWNHP